jgi:hypothetical protein
VVTATTQPLYHRKQDRISIVQEAGWTPVQLWTGAEIMVLTGIWSPDRSFRIYLYTYTHLYICAITILLSIILVLLFLLLSDFALTQYIGVASIILK